MKILMFLTYYHPHRTGLTLFVQRLAERLVQKGHQVTVVSCQFRKDLAKGEVLNGVRVIRIPAFLSISRGMVMPQFPFYAFNQIKKNDLILVHTPMLETALVALMTKLSGKPLVLTHHGDLVLPAGALNRFIEMVVQTSHFFAAHCAEVLTASSLDYAQYSKYLSPFLSKVQVIYPPAAVEPSTLERAAAYKRSLGLENSCLIGYAGRFVEEKRPDRLLKALPHLLKKIPNAKLVFAGEYLIRYEDYFGKFSRIIDAHKNAIIFLGLLKNESQVADFYAMCDVLALPSETECLGLVQVEAMLCGTPVVVNDVPGAREAVKVIGMGEITKCDDPVLFAETLEKVIRNRNLYKKSPEEIQKIYGNARNADQNESLFKKILKGER